MNEKRNYLLDMLKCFAALAVIFLHIPLDDLQPSLATDLSFFCRWAVPFFFIATGFYLRAKSSAEIISLVNLEKPLSRLFYVFMIANIIYLLYAWVSGYFWVQNDVKYIFIGTFWHLWFIGAMIFGYLLIWFLDKNFGRKIVYFLGLVTLVVLLTISEYGYYWSLIPNYAEIPRYFSGFAFMTLGMIFREINCQKLKKSWMLVLLVLSILLMIFELQRMRIEIDEKLLIDNELTFGITFFTIFLFINSQLFVVSKPNLLSRIGERYSLLIYLYHVLFYKFAIKIFHLFRIDFQHWYLLSPFIVFALLSFFAFFMEKRLTRVFALLNGKP